MTRNDPQTLQTADTIQIDIKGVPSTTGGRFPDKWCNDNFSTTRGF